MMVGILSIKVKLDYSDHIEQLKKNIINCTKFTTFYVGETQRKVSTRIREHLRDIKKFIPYIQFNSEVSFHFNLKGHRNHHFCFFIV